MSTASNQPIPSTPMQRPHGLLLFSLRLPVWLYRFHFGWVLGNRFLLLNHIGRSSGLIRQSVIEVVKHDQESGSYFVVSSWGNRSDWYQNVHKHPKVVIYVGRRKLQVHAEDILLPEAIAILEEYTRHYPFAFKELTRLFLGERMQPGREASERLAKEMPMVAFRPSK